jgi:hypothetical protein
MPVKPKKTTKARTAKKAKKPTAKAILKKAKKAKKPAAKKASKKAVAKKSRGAKTIKMQKTGKRKPAKKSVRKATNKRVAKTAWKISPEISQSVVEMDIWKKGDLKIEFLKVYRSGWIIVDQLPDLSGYNPDEGVNILEEFEFDEHQLHDVSQESTLFPNELALEERERLMALSEAELVDEGWTLESVTRFSGPLLVEEV